jgi:hypothetical protein
MSKKSKNTDVGEALDLLSDEVRGEIARIREEGAEAMRKGDYDTAKSVIEFAGKLERFAENVDKLVGQWNTIAQQHETEPEEVKKIVSKGIFLRAKKGTITTHEEFRRPLLQALVEMGGKGKTRAVVDRVGKLMEGKLKPRDFEPLPSDPEMIRWRNKLMWTRNTLVNVLGHMKSDSPRGVWEISEKGRQWLEKQTS